MQCHECGFWYPSLSVHIKQHRDDDGDPLTGETYRTRHGLPATQRLATAAPIDRGQIALWGKRLHDAGFSAWDEALIFAAENHLGFRELAPLLDSRPRNLAVAVGNALHGDWSMTRPYVVSRPGLLADDGERVQCHVCGLWFKGLAVHVKTHLDEDGTPFTPDTYRVSFGLRAGFRLNADPAHLVEGCPRTTAQIRGEGGTPTG